MYHKTHDGKLPNDVISLVAANDQAWAQLREWMDQVDEMELYSLRGSIASIVSQPGLMEAMHTSHHLRYCLGCMPDKEMVWMAYLANAAMGVLLAKHNEGDGDESAEDATA